MIRISVPATTANVGPGFDCLGLALGLFNEYEVELSDKLLIEGCPKEFANSDNLFYKAYLKGCELLGVKDEIHVIFNTLVPVSRGLGSSASLIVGGLVASSVLHDNGLSDEDIIRLATVLEGHPDNAVPAYLGGLTACVMKGDRPLVIRKLPHADLRFTVFIPDFEVSTEKARGILPKEIALKDAVFSSSRAIMMFNALESGDEEMLQEAGQDRLHEPYRSKLIDGFEGIKEEALKNGAFCFLVSGSGSTCLAISKIDDLPVKMSGYLSALDHKWQCFNLKANNEKVKVS